MKWDTSRMTLRECAVGCFYCNPRVKFLKPSKVSSWICYDKTSAVDHVGFRTTKRTET